MAQPAGHPVRETPWRIGHDAVRLPRQAELAQITAYDRDIGSLEAPLQLSCPTGMEFDCDHLCAGPYERGCQRSVTGSKIDDEIGCSDAGAGDDVPSGSLIEPVKSPSDR